jgi:hypothetical protein
VQQLQAGLVTSRDLDGKRERLLRVVGEIDRHQDGLDRLDRSRLLLFPQRQDRARSEADDLLGDASQEQTCRTPTSVGPHHDQVDVVLVGVVENHLAGGEAPDFGLADGESLGLALLDDVGHLRVRDLEELLEYIGGLGKLLRRIARVVVMQHDGVEHVQLGLELFREKEGLHQRLIGAGRKVGGVEDLTDLQHDVYLPWGLYSSSVGGSTMRFLRA